MSELLLPRKLMGISPDFRETSPIKTVALLGPRDPKKLGAIESAILRALVHNNIVANYINSLDANSSDIDRVLIVGPASSHIEQISSLSRLRGTLPPLRVWFTEQLPNPDLPTATTEFLSTMRYKADYYVSGHHLPGGRFRALGEVIALNQLTTDLKVHTFSMSNTIFLCRMGIPAETTPFGTHEMFGKRSSVPFEEREIPVLFLGSRGKRREPIVQKIQGELADRDIHLTLRDDRNPIYSRERTDLLGNTKILLAIGRQPYDDHHFRLIMGGTNGVLVIAENTVEAARGEFRPGEHYIESNIENMPDTISYCLQNPGEVIPIAERLNSQVNKTMLNDQIIKVLQ